MNGQITWVKDREDEVDLSGIFRNLKLDTWYKAFVYLGGLVLLISFFVEVKGITNTQLQLLAGGCFFIGIGEWKNHKVASWIKPPNVYTGPAALIKVPIRKADWVGRILDTSGLVLVGLGLYSVINGL